MILYKYTSLEAGTRILESGSIGFSEPRHFNDPFETAGRIRDRSTEGFTMLIQTPGGETVQAKNLFSCHNHTTNFWSSNFAVLSLTRQPLNKLMMAHYANEHRGMIIGFDISKIPDFIDENWAFIPAQHGNIIYTATLPVHPSISAGEFGSKLKELSLEGRQRAFLYKDAVWSMEEEVRIVRFLGDQQHGFKTIEVNERPLYLYSLPDGAIAEVHFCSRAKILPAMDGDYDVWIKLKDALERHSGCALNLLDLALDRWGVVSEPISIGAIDGYWQLHHDRQSMND